MVTPLRRFLAALVFSLAILTLVLLPYREAAAKKDSYTNKTSSKLDRGLWNFLAGFAEVPYSIHMETKEHNSVIGVPMGFFKGLGRGLRRELIGVYEVVTCFIPQGPILQPIPEWQW